MEDVGIAIGVEVNGCAADIGRDLPWWRGVAYDVVEAAVLDELNVWRGEAISEVADARCALRPCQRLES